jgi:hypothetical protein
MLTVRLAALRGPGWEDLNPYKTDIKSLLSDPESPYRMIVFAIERDDGQVVWVARFHRSGTEWAVEGLVSSSPVDGACHDNNDTLVLLRALPMESA